MRRKMQEINEVMSQSVAKVVLQVEIQVWPAKQVVNVPSLPDTKNTK